MGAFVTVGEFIKDFRNRVGDTTCEIPVAHLLSTINLSLSRIARIKGLHPLFRRQETLELRSINTDGTPSASWLINTDDTYTIFDVESLVVIDNSGTSQVVCPLDMIYREYRSFRKKNPLPEAKEPGTPTEYTFGVINGNIALIFDRPIAKATAIDVLYDASHPRVTNESQWLKIPALYVDIIQEYVNIYYHMESADFASARALYEDIDVLTSETRELLAKNPDSADYRRVKGAFF